MKTSEVFDIPTRKVQDALSDLHELNELRLQSNQKELLENNNRKQAFSWASKYAGVKLFDGSTDYEKSSALLDDACSVLSLHDIIE